MENGSRLKSFKHGVFFSKEPFSILKASKLFVGKRRICRMTEMSSAVDNSVFEFSLKWIC